MQDLRSAVLKICNFIGKKLSEEEIEIAIKGKGKFLRKGKTEADCCDNYLIPPLSVK